MTHWVPTDILQIMHILYFFQQKSLCNFVPWINTDLLQVNLDQSMKRPPVASDSLSGHSRGLVVILVSIHSCVLLFLSTLRASSRRSKKSYLYMYIINPHHRIHMSMQNTVITGSHGSVMIQTMPL